MNKDLEKRLKNIEAEKKIAMNNLFYAVRGDFSRESVEQLREYHYNLATEYCMLFNEMMKQKMIKRLRK